MQGGKHALGLSGKLCFTTLVAGVLVLTIITATYESDNPLFHSSDKITSFLTSKSNANFQSDNTVVKIGDDFMAADQTSFTTFINITDLAGPNDAGEMMKSDCEGELGKPIDCKDPEVFHMMMKATIEMFKDKHFYRFGKPVRGLEDNTCDMAWRFRPKDEKSDAFLKDYRRFVISRSVNCAFNVTSVGDYHTGGNARKRKKKQLVFENAGQKEDAAGLPAVGDTVNDTLPIVESEEAFKNGKYLVYSGGGDRCKNMNQYLWSFSCALGEAQYLNRTLVMDLSLCLSSIYTKSNQNEEGKDFRYYFDFEHLKQSASVLGEAQFWMDWNKWNRKYGLILNLVEDFRITPMKLKEVKDALIVRKFGTVEPDNFWYRVCEGDAESVIQRPWNLLWKSRRLMNIVSTIAAKLNGDYDSVHVVRGEKARNTDLWPNLDRDTSPDALPSKLRDRIEEGRSLYVATNEPNTSIFDPLKDKYMTHFLDDHKDLWDEKSEWHSETTKINGSPVEFDGYMRILVDTEVFLRGKKQIETFNDLTNDCRDGVNMCSTSSVR